MKIEPNTKVAFIGNSGFNGRTIAFSVILYSSLKIIQLYDVVEPSIQSARRGCDSLVFFTTARPRPIMMSLLVVN